MIRYFYRFTGRVQGVGFRWTARTLADSLGLTGWVSNEWDGSVTMELQGDEERITRMVNALQGGRYIEIENMERKKIRPLEHESSFQVRH